MLLLLLSLLLLHAASTFTCTQDTCTCGEDETGWFGDWNTCDVYYGCVSGLIYPYTCADGTLWDTTTGDCNWEDQVDCASGGVCDKASAVALREAWKEVEKAHKISFSVKVKVVEEGSTASVKCKKGYKLQGQDTLTCNQGEWGELPSCVGTCNKKAAKALIKATKKVDQYQGVTFNVKSLKKVKEGTTATITCEEEHEFAESQDGALTCSAGDWGALPDCQKIKYCSKKSYTELKDAVEGIANAEGVSFSVSKKDITEGSTATVTCAEGSSLTGSSVLTCYHNSWGTLPTCEEEAGPGLEEVLTEDQFNTLFPNRNEGGDAAYLLYEYQYLVEAALAYPSFANEGTLEIRRREVAAFLANIGQETTGGWDTAPGGRYYWGLYWLQELGFEESIGYCDSSNTQYPCQSGRSYHGRGPLQLSWNYNYGLFSEQVLGDKMELLNNPERVSQEGTIAFQAALWFWMTAQAPKPSCHDVITEQWEPTAADVTCDRGEPGFGSTINIINGGIECGSSPPLDKTLHRVEGYSTVYVEGLGTTPGENLFCETQQNFAVCNEWTLA